MPDTGSNLGDGDVNVNQFIIIIVYCIGSLFDAQIGGQVMCRYDERKPLRHVPQYDVHDPIGYNGSLYRIAPSHSSTMNHDNQSISRATSVSRASRRSSVSRSQSLINKNIAPHDLRPSDVLIERFVAWKAIVKQLIAYFEVCG